MAALQVLALCDEQLFVSVAMVGTAIDGWATWRDNAKPSLRLLWEQGYRDISLQSDPRHPLAGIIGNAAPFSLEWPAGAGEVTLDTPGMRSSAGAFKPVSLQATAQLGRLHRRRSARRPWQASITHQKAPRGGGPPHGAGNSQGQGPCNGFKLGATPIMTWACRRFLRVRFFILLG